MQNSIQKFRQNSIVFDKPGNLFEKLKTLTSSNYQRLNDFSWNFSHVSYLPMSTEGCVGFFILFRTWVTFQNQKDLVFTHSQKPRLSIPQDLNKIKKKSHTPFCRHWLDGSMCKISAKNINL